MITAAAARAAGLSHYFSGKPCPSGHIAKRRVSNNSCSECVKRDSLQYYHEHRDERTEFNRSYMRSRPGYANHKVSLQRARSLGRLPADADLEKVIGVYEDAMLLQGETGVKIEVDHILPYCRGGLHVHTNLQLLTKSQHKMKSKMEKPV